MSCDQSSACVSYAQHLQEGLQVTTIARRPIEKRETITRTFRRQELLQAALIVIQEPIEALVADAAVEPPPCVQSNPSDTIQ